MSRSKMKDQDFHHWDELSITGDDGNLVNLDYVIAKYSLNELHVDGAYYLDRFQDAARKLLGYCCYGSLRS